MESLKIKGSREEEDSAGLLNGSSYESLTSAIFKTYLWRLLHITSESLREEDVGSN